MSHFKAEPLSVTRVYRNVNQAGWLNNVWNQVEPDTTDFDRLGEWQGAPNYQFVPLYAGYYLIIGSIMFATGFNTSDEVQIRLNGVTPLATASVNSTATIGHKINCQTIEYLTPNDNIQLWARWTLGAVGGNLSNGRANVFLCIKRIA